MDVADAKDDVLSRLSEVRAFPANESALAQRRHSRGLGLLGSGGSFRGVPREIPLTRLRGRSHFGVAKARRSDTLYSWVRTRSTVSLELFFRWLSKVRDGVESVPTRFIGSSLGVRTVGMAGPLRPRRINGGAAARLRSPICGQRIQGG